MKCEKCGAASGFAPRFPCVHPPCDGERYLDKEALEAQVAAEVRAAVAPLVAAVREWQEARKAMDGDRYRWTGPGWFDICRRSEVAEEALAAWNTRFSATKESE